MKIDWKDFKVLDEGIVEFAQSSFDNVCCFKWHDRIHTSSRPILITSHVNVATNVQSTNNNGNLAKMSVY